MGHLIAGGCRSVLLLNQIGLGMDEVLAHKVGWLTRPAAAAKTSNRR